MHSIVEISSNYLFQALYQQFYCDKQEDDTSGFSYETLTLSIIAVMSVAYVIKTLYQPVLDTPERFWKELNANKRNPPAVGPIIVNGKVLAKNFDSLQEEMFSSCNKMSEIFVEYVEQKGLKPGSVLDIGCGIGANSFPLLQYGIKVIAIDNLECLLNIYSSQINNEEKRFVSLQCSDLINLKKYSPEDHSIDVALAIDVFPYLPSSSWESTMKKIVLSLKPGGYLFGTIFVKKKWFNPSFIKLHETLGAQYYSIQNLSSRLIKHSGLEMIECRIRKDSIGCYEFVARKPIHNKTQIFFDDLPKGDPLIIEEIYI